MKGFFLIIFFNHLSTVRAAAIVRNVTWFSGSPISWKYLTMLGHDNRDAGQSQLSTVFSISCRHCQICSFFQSKICFHLRYRRQLNAKLKKMVLKFKSAFFCCACELFCTCQKKKKTEKFDPLTTHFQQQAPYTGHTMFLLPDLFAATLSSLVCINNGQPPDIRVKTYHTFI